MLEELFIKFFVLEVFVFEFNFLFDLLVFELE